MKKWERVIVETPAGPREAVAPVILSASRATDIPAFHLPWLRERLAAGWLAWQNPFNRQEQIVSLARARAIVFWTKNARPLLDCLEAFSRFRFYVTFTVNDYEAEGLEPGIPPLQDRMATFRELARRLGRQRVVWRFDPLMLVPGLGVPELLDRVARVGEVLHSCTEKLVFSLADIAEYPAVDRRLRRAGIGVQEWTPDQVERLAAGLAGLGRTWGLRVATCAESQDFSSFGIEANRCIDDELMHRAFPEDHELQRFLGFDTRQGNLFEAPPSARPPLKDKGQRRECGCIMSKDIGRYGTCSHGCLYCYANTR
ncbi:MAG: DUF1848 domain-containing protein [Candidatus Riflebacteria bacterium]|nr:DUF1848 domain-containing protein [Candidatus Riflebacteria bacterium]